MKTRMINELEKWMLGNRVNQEHFEFYMAEARTMAMMYETTGDSTYLERARYAVQQAKCVLHGGFIRPRGVIFKEAA